MYIKTYHERQSVEFPLGPKYNELLHSWDLGEVVWADRMCDGRHQLSCCHRNAFWNLYQTHNNGRGGVGVGEEGSADCAYQGCVYAYRGRMRFTASAPPVTSSTGCPPSDCHRTALQGSPQGNVSSAMHTLVVRSIAAVNRDTPVVRVTKWLPKVAHWLMRDKPYTYSVTCTMLEQVGWVDR